MSSKVCLSSTGIDGTDIIIGLNAPVLEGYAGYLYLSS
jgi:hypothetical protein